MKYTTATEARSAAGGGSLNYSTSLRSGPHQPSPLWWLPGLLTWPLHECAARHRPHRRRPQGARAGAASVGNACATMPSNGFTESTAARGVPGADVCRHRGCASLLHRSGGSRVPRRGGVGHGRNRSDRRRYPFVGRKGFRAVGGRGSGRGGCWLGWPLPLLWWPRCGGLVPGEAEQMAGGVWSRLLDYSIRDAFERLGLSEVWAETQQANTASLRMLERAGFKRSTTLTRHAQVQAVLVLRR